MKKPKIKSEYNQLVNITVGVRKGSGMVLLPRDLIWVFNKSGYYAELLEIDGKCFNIFVSPPRHLITGEDVKLTQEENK